MDNWELYYRTHKDKGSNAITGVPPLTFVSNGKNLVDYRIYGASGGVGDRAENLFDASMAFEAGYINDIGDIITVDNNMVHTRDYIPIKNSSQYVLAGKLVPPEIIASVAMYDAQKNYISRITGSAGQNRIVFTTTNNCSYVRFNVNDGYFGFHFDPNTIMLNNGYKIPIVCGGATTNIYLNEPLGENESISMNDTGLSIPTINGTNILTVDTEVQPSKMYIKYGGSNNVNRALMKYLEYKYKFAKE